MPRLGVNIDHVATVRNARGTSYPDPIEAARIALSAGAHGITAHLREDRRHISDQDIRELRALVKNTGTPEKGPDARHYPFGPSEAYIAVRRSEWPKGGNAADGPFSGVPKLNMEMALTPEMVDIARVVRPDYVCLVPERRQELTTEGGLSLEELDSKRQLIHALKASEIKVSLFMAPHPKTIDTALRIAQPHAIELHTGDYAHGMETSGALDQIQALEACSKIIIDAGVECHAGHGLTLENIEPLLNLRVFEEYNIGHAIVAQSIFDSLFVVVKKYLTLMERYPLS